MKNALTKDDSLGRLPRQSLVQEPVHLQLAAVCREAIISGEFASGDRFPSERELSERYDVSRATANKSIATLIAEGFLELKRGIGTRVIQRRTLFASLDGMESFTAHARKQGRDPSTKVLRFERLDSGDLPMEVLEGLGLSPNKRESIVFLERLRLADGVPMIHETRWVREVLAPKLSEEDVSASFYRMLEEKYGLTMSGENHTIEAALMNDDMLSRMGMNPPSVALKVEGTGFVDGDEALWYQKLNYRGDKYQLHNRTGSGGRSSVELRIRDIEA